MVKLRQNIIIQVLCIGIVFLVFRGCPHDIDDVQDITINNNSEIELVFYKEYKIILFINIFVYINKIKIEFYK